MKCIDNINDIIDKYNSEAFVFKHNGIFICSNFPNDLEPNIKDYIDCNFNILDTNHFSIKFDLKYETNKG